MRAFKKFLANNPTIEKVLSDNDITIGEAYAYFKALRKHYGRQDKALKSQMRLASALSAPLWMIEKGHKIKDEVNARFYQDFNEAKDHFKNDIDMYEIDLAYWKKQRAEEVRTGITLGFRPQHIVRFLTPKPRLSLDR